MVAYENFILECVERSCVRLFGGLCASTNLPGRPPLVALLGKFASRDYDCDSTSDNGKPLTVIIVCFSISVSSQTKGSVCLARIVRGGPMTRERQLNKMAMQQIAQAIVSIDNAIVVPQPLMPCCASM